MSVLINAANLHFGGGIQVASSFIFEISKILSSNKAYKISVICSDKVFDNLPSELNKRVFSSFEVINVYGMKQPSKHVKEKFNGYDVCFTIFGPLYFSPKVNSHICGFAQAWIAYPKNIAYKQLSFIDYLKSKIKFRVQSFFFRRYDHLIVEQNHIKSALGKLKFNPNKISIVSNCVSSIYDDSTSWLPLEFDDNFLVEDITLGFIGRAYPHKNVSILTQVNDILIKKYQMKCNFLFTFTDVEMKNSGFSEYNNFHSVGEISSAQCPEFYRKLDALVFPSLLECFSVSPIEAMKMNTTVIASDFPFVKEVCKNAAFYFNPFSAHQIAESVYNAFSNQELREEKIQLGCKLVNELPTAKERAISYLNIIENNV